MKNDKITDCVVGVTLIAATSILFRVSDSSTKIMEATLGDIRDAAVLAAYYAIALWVIGRR